MKQPTLIFGAGTLARLACLSAQEQSGLDVVGFVVDDGLRTVEQFLDLPVYDWTDALKRFAPSKVWFHVAVGYREMRRRAAVFQQVQGAGFECVNIVSPVSCVSRHASLGVNNFIMAGTVVEPGMHIGSNNVVWSNVTLCHDGVLGNHNFIAANTTVGGHVTIGDLNFLGFSSVVRERVRIGDETLVGAQSLLLADPLGLSVYFGSPARKIRPVNPALGLEIE